MIDIDIVEQLIPNPMTMLVQLCSTLVLFLLMKKFLWKSVKNFLDVRADKMLWKNYRVQVLEVKRL